MASEVRQNFEKIFLDLVDVPSQVGFVLEWVLAPIPPPPPIALISKCHKIFENLTIRIVLTDIPEFFAEEVLMGKGGNRHV